MLVFVVFVLVSVGKRVSLCLIVFFPSLGNSSLHRELPGFGSTRLLLGTVSQELDSWRAHVETAICDVYDHYTKTANVLATKLMSQVNNILDMAAVVVQ
jgi:hypothetical protein